MSHRRAPLLTLIAVLVALLTIARPVHTGATTGASALDVVISEIAWMGTTASPTDEWIELYNNTRTNFDLTGWTLHATDGTPSITLSGTIPAGGYFLLERTDDDSVPGVAADQTYTGALDTDGEELFLHNSSFALIDEVDCASRWYSGHDRARVPMVRMDTRLPGTGPSNWTYNPRCGTATNSAGATYECPYIVYSTSDPLDYAVYFNERATTASGPMTEPTAMENALLSFIDRATTSIDGALYGLDRQGVVDALIAAHDSGVTVRVVGDDEAATDPEYGSSYQALSDAGIPVVTDASLGKIQYNKFLVLDGSVVWTGSTNFTDTGLTLNANSSIVITGTGLASNYTAEFEEMWAGRFDGDKTVNTIQHLDYGGTIVESYFSPTDWPAFEVWLELAKAEQTIHFAMFSWTDELLSKRVAERMGAGVEVYGVWDQFGAANVSSQDEMLCLAGARIGIENLPGKVHHKFAVIDVEGDDPMVIVGSYNWTEAGAYDNDENMLILHDRELARAYYAEWQRLWATVPVERVCNPFEVYLPLVLQPEPPVQIVFSYLSRPRQSPYEIVGYVRNVASSTVYSVTLLASLYDNADELIGTYSGTTALVATFPGELNPLAVWTDIYYDEPSRYELVVDGWTMISEFEYKPVTVVSQEIDKGSISTLVSGEIRNDQSRDLYSIRVLVEPGTNGPFQFAGLSATTLAPGETATYSTGILHPWEPPPNYVIVQGQGYLKP